MCQNLQLYIINGRVGSDKGKGLYTCKASSVIDYMIAPPALFKIRVDFHLKK